MCVSLYKPPVISLPSFLGPGVNSVLIIVFHMPSPHTPALHHWPALWLSGFPDSALNCQLRRGGD